MVRIIFLLDSTGRDNVNIHLVDYWITNRVKGDFTPEGKDSLLPTKTKLCLNYKFYRNFHFQCNPLINQCSKFIMNGNHFYIIALVGNVNTSNCHFLLNETPHLNLCTVEIALCIFLHHLWAVAPWKQRPYASHLWTNHPGLPRTEGFPGRGNFSAKTRIVQICQQDLVDYSRGKKIPQTLQYYLCWICNKCSINAKPVN